MEAAPAQLASRLFEVSQTPPGWCCCSMALFSTGHALEGYATGRARRAIEALAVPAADTAVVRRPDGEHEVPVDQLLVGGTS